MIIDCEAPEGNAFVIMGYVSQLLKAVGRKDEWPEVRKKMMAGDYKNLLKVAREATFDSIEFVNVL